MPNVSPSGRDLSVVANALLKAAAELGFNPNVVQTHGDGVYGMGFRAPAEVVEIFHLFMDESLDPIHVEVPETLQVQAGEPETGAPEGDPEPPRKRGPGRPKNVDKEAS